MTHLEEAVSNSIELQGKTKQEQYIVLKKIVDRLHMKDIETCVSEVCSPAYKVQEALSSTDIHELTEVAEDLCHYMSQAVDNGICIGLLEKVRNYFSYINMTIEFNADTIVVAHTMKSFYQLVYEYRNEFITLEPNEIALVDGFVKDFKQWVYLTFVKKGNNKHELDDSIISNFIMIEQMVTKMNTCDDPSSLDDIFDF